MAFQPAHKGSYMSWSLGGMLDCFSTGSNRLLCSKLNLELKPGSHLFQGVTQLFNGVSDASDIASSIVQKGDYAC